LILKSKRTQVVIDSKKIPYLPFQGSDQMQAKKPSTYSPTGWRFRLGLTFFALGWICPLFVPLVTSSSLSTEAKTLFSGILIVGVPEIFSVISIVFLGKDGFNYIKERIFTFLKRIVPKGEVSRIRYRIGLVLLFFHVIYANLIFYSPHLIKGYAANSMVMNMCADVLFIVTLFVLGGNFWEKLRALFIYDAKVIIPESL
jgi:hypothetical protein